MQIVLTHNAYGKFSGEEAAVENLKDLLKSRRQQVCTFERSSEEIDDMPGGKLRAFLGGIYNPFSRKQFVRFLKAHKPDLVHIHNLYPLISPSILPECKRQSVPVVMTVHNFRLICPNGLFFTRGRLCHRCVGGREYHCILNNCENSVFKSTGYALRTFVARMFRLYKKNVDYYICISSFQKRVLVREGFPSDRIRVIPNPISITDADQSRALNESPSVDCGYVAYAGRIESGKGIFTLLEAASALPDVSFKIAGDCTNAGAILQKSPENVEFVGFLKGEALSRFYRNCSMFVFPTCFYEGFPTVLVEAMQHKKAIVCSNIGGLPDIVETGRNGLLFETGNGEDLADKIQMLRDDPALRDQLGQGGFDKVHNAYHPDTIYRQLMEVYQAVVAESGKMTG